MWQLSFVGFFSIFRITKCEKAILLFDRLFLESASGIIECARLLLQSGSGITKCDRGLGLFSYLNFKVTYSLNK